MAVVPFDEFTRRARPVRVVDGDTVVLQVDLGFYTTHESKFRLLGVDTPEKNSRDPEERLRAHEATVFVEMWMDAAGDYQWPLAVRVTKAGKYGRWIAQVWRIEDGNDLGVDLLESGHAQRYPA